MTAFLQDIAALADQGAALTGLPGGALAFAVAQLLDRPLWVVVPEAEQAERLYAELCFVLGEQRAWLYPADDVKPYEGLSPHPELPRARLAALDAVSRGGPQVIVAPALALLPLALPPALLAASPVLRRGGALDPQAFAAQLADLGYLAVGRVEDPGTFRARGEVIDVWPTGAKGPARVELFDEEIELLRALDPKRQRSGEALSSLRVLPAREEVLGAEPLSRAREVLREAVAETGYGARLRREIVEDFKAGIRSSGCGAYLSALHPLVSVFAHTPGARELVVEPERCVGLLAEARRKAEQRYAGLAHGERPLLSPEHRYADADALADVLLAATPVQPRGYVPHEGQVLVDLGAQDNKGVSAVGGELAVAAGKIAAWLEDGWRVAVVADGHARAERLRQLIHPHGLDPIETSANDPARWPPGQLVLARGDMPRGFHQPDAGLAVLSVDELLGEKVRVRSPQRSRAHLHADAAVQSFAHLKEGDLVVHERHGVGRFLGLRRVDSGHGVEDMVQLEYRGGDRMYLPAQRLDQLFRYRAIGGRDNVRLDKLGGETWDLRKAKVKDSVLKLAHELISLQARREVHPGYAYEGLSARYRRFEDSFPYTETRDQAAAIDAVLEDLAKPEPTDRLIVGDVGFGKTEVAMRAAFRVAEEGRQVVLLCPTTVLAFQHARTVSERFEPFGFKVGLLSRFGTSAESRALLRELKEGEVQVVVGTTRLLGRGVRYKDLGLVIVDEEHRFGVAQKERLKRLRAEVDYVAMSATPIPRSLHQAMSGIRKISVIATPPRDRLPVHTLVARSTEARVREELLREVQRGGQAFFVHNRVASIEAVARMVRKAVPEASLDVAHGQMDDDQLEDVLVRFVERRFDVLVCTSIVEAGIDMPNVNTIVVNQADRFGLAQLYQLRGRVGRSHLRGYCTLLIDEGKTLTREAMQRLRVLQEHTALGSGFAVATADLELRGAGNLLGDKQHGHIAAVGFETYLALLDEAMREAQGHSERERIDPDIEIGLPAFLPESYVPDIEERLALYKRLSTARSPAEVRDAVDEIEDGYGPLPPETVNLGRTLELKARCRSLGVRRLSVLKVRAVLELAESTCVTPEALQRLIASAPRRFSYADQRLEARFTPEEGARIFMFLHWLLGALEKPSA